MFNEAEDFLDHELMERKSQRKLDSRRKSSSRVKSKSVGTAEIDVTVKLDRASYVPYYEQIIAQLRHAIQSESLRPGQKLWSQRELAEKLGISVLPVKRAFERLRAEGLLLTAKGKRPVVGAGNALWNVQDLWGFTEQIQDRGLKPTTRLLRFAVIPADKEISEALQIEESDEVYEITRLRSVQEGPMALETTHLPVALFPTLETQDLGANSLYAVIENVFGRRLDRGEERIGAVNAGHEEAQLLKVEVGFPLLSSRRMVCDTNGTPIEYGLSLFRADRYQARILTLRRRPDELSS
jgi:GntR family transcriptional regulator